MITTPPKVSIGLPVFNGQNFLVEAIDSILCQTFTDFELIISDNGSTDATSQICEQYARKDPRIRYYRQNKNLGAAQNFNFVFQISYGEYFKWAAHDDVCAPEFIEQCVVVLDREPNVVVCYPQTTFIDKYGQLQDSYADNLNLRSSAPSDRFRNFLSRPGWCHPVFGLIRSKTLKKTPLIGNYPRSDRNLIGELALHGEICELRVSLFLRRLHSQISTNVNLTEIELATWFDPAKKGKRVFPRWRRFAEYLRAVGQAPIAMPEKIRCYLALARFLLIPKRWSGLFDDLIKSAPPINSSLLLRVLITSFAAVTVWVFLMKKQKYYSQE